MVTEAPGYVSALFIALTAVLAALFIVGAAVLGTRAKVERVFGLPIVWFAAGGLGLWLALVTAGSLNGWYADFSTLPPAFIRLIGPALIIVFVIAFSPVAGRLLDVCPPEWLIAPQAFRVAMEVILWLLFIEGGIPVQMTFEGRNLDIVAGLTAPLAAYLVARRSPWAWWTGVLWNLAALGLLANIVIVAILSTPTVFWVSMNEPANTIVAYFPFAWLPGVVVPFALLLHLLSLRQLLTGRAAAFLRAP